MNTDKLTDLPLRYKGGSFYRVYFYDEAPRIGSGWRTVFVKEGRKWAHIYYPPIHGGVRLKASLWDKIKRD
jgi:hypothetical protein